MYTYLLVISTALLVSAYAENVCPKGSIVYKNDQPFYWPPSWRENTTAPGLQAGQVCSWTVVIPDAFYAKLIINGKTSDNLSRFQLIDSAGNFIQTSDEGMQPYYFPGPKLTIALSVESAATFGFKVVWSKLPAFIIGGTGVDRGVQVLNISDPAIGGYYSSHTQMSVLPFPVDPNNAYAYRSVLVYNGYQANQRYATNLFQIYQTQQQWVSSESVIYLLNLEPSSTLDKVLLQEYSYTKDIQQYVELRCGDGPTCSATLNAGSQTSALIDIDNVNRTLTNIEMDPSAFLNVWFGPPRPDSFHYTYNGTAINEALPIRFPRSYVTQYVISSGRAVFTFSN